MRRPSIDWRPMMAPPQYNRVCYYPPDPPPYAYSPLEYNTVTLQQQTMSDAIDDILNNLLDVCGQNPNPSIQITDAVDMLENMYGGFTFGYAIVPAELAVARGNTQLESAAAYSCIANIMADQQARYTAPNPDMTDLIQGIRAMVDTIKTEDQASGAPVSGASSTQAAGDTKRPGVSVLQSSNGDQRLRSMTNVKNRHHMVTIGSGTETIDYLDLRPLGISGADCLKVMHPLQQANIAKQRTPLLLDLHRSLGGRLTCGRHGRPQGAESEAILTSFEALQAELKRRDIELPSDAPPVSAMTARQASQYGSPPDVRRMPSFGLVQVPLRAPSYIGKRAPSYAPNRSPSYGPSRITLRTSFVRNRGRTSGPSRPGARTPSYLARQPSYYGSRPASLYGRTASANSVEQQRSGPTLARGASSSRLRGSGGFQEYLEPTPEVGSGTVYHEYLFLGRDAEVEVHHPLTYGDLPSSLKESQIIYLKHALELLNAGISRSDLSNPMFATRYATRRQSIETINEWLHAEKLAKDDLAAEMIEASERQGWDPHHSTDSEDGGTADVGPTAHSKRDKGKAPARGRVSAIRVPQAGPPSIKRNVSFNKNKKFAPESAVRRPGLHPRIGSMRSGRNAMHSRNASFLRPYLEQRASSGYMPAFPASGRVKTQLAQQEAQAVHLHEATNETAEVDGGKVDSGEVDSIKVDGAEVAKTEPTANVSPENTSIRADSGSDVGDPQDFPARPLANEPFASTHEAQAKVEDSEDDDRWPAR
ncbi:hypothetical protein BAUCODRAFT_215866 [Baudoinia panamericana UAMH 10762]|uniref:Uncharacterized protein n=1 Tax=Baudoinia panamericana (strain UAMH 10762) TaxID=717646 RepID=M2MR54_BAUPA|nr:uncharacterized protein BAUCODRAFT_215866 [Baudoinia panamericana UAMH 10762]EMC93943.1 hypothetical protein BAUCODRAFT_215866 [Baudoinia panamericana UAMH 10762]